MATGIFALLNVADLDVSQRFYRSLGLRVLSESARMTDDFTMRWASVLNGPDHRLLLFDRAVPGASPEDLAWASGDVGKGVLLNMGVGNAAKAHASAKAAGNKPEALTPNPWGGQAFNIADPDGYYVHVTDNFPTAPKKAARRKPAAKGKTARSRAKKSAKASPTKSAKKGANAARRRRR